MTPASGETDRLTFIVTDQQVIVRWQGRALTYSYWPTLPPYIGLHYDLAHIHDGKETQSSSLGQKLKSFLGDAFDDAVRDPDGWLRNHMSPDVDAWTLRKVGESEAEWFRRVFRSR